MTPNREHENATAQAHRRDARAAFAAIEAAAAQLDRIEPGASRKAQWITRRRRDGSFIAAPTVFRESST